MPRTIHIIGAGLAGLSAAVELTQRGETVVMHEATNVAGGRCRSYHDAALGMMIDNGNHLLLSGNHAALRYLRTLGAEQRLVVVRRFPTVVLRFADRVPGETGVEFFVAGRSPGDDFPDRYVRLLRCPWSLCPECRAAAVCGV